MLEPAEQWREPEDEESCDDRHQQVAPVPDGCRRDVADEDVADDASTESRDRRKHEDSEDVEMLADGEQASSQGKDEDPGQVEGDDGVVRAGTRRP